MSTGDTSPVLECRGLRKRYGHRQAVDGVSFRVGQGETYGLLGPNGAGKTTTISMLCGIIERDAGDVVVAGEPVRTDRAGAKAAVGYVPQEIALYPDLSGRENLRFFGRLQGLGGAELDRRVEAVLAVVGLADRAGDRVGSYSGGMQRRANIAAGLVHSPKLLVLDEPTVGVDPQSRNAILESIEALGTEGMAVLYTTHYMEEAERLCDRIGIIDEGRIIAEGTRRELVAGIGEHDRLRIHGQGDLVRFAEACAGLDGVVEATATDGAVEVLARDGRRTLAPVVAAAERLGVEISGIDVVEPDLEAVFLRLTGKALRD
jgi:ABC-2 type transport system ATP-binding protein